ncbi:hypothetical protein [Psychromonas antarctica]|uniref:hypothetical protein n=1 Tax=Psychromonas antarctica TaxID=67573 RepID=UPI001EE8D75B|nr:hypothetical protein [Psychromonas antarctica]MCG6200294.1 hypothetical protein [Psychromonas antarctica]
MLKKFIILSLVTSLWACSHLSSRGDLSNAVENVNIRATYIEVLGKKIIPDNLSADGHGVLESTVFITANFAKEKVAPSSELQMTLGYFKNYNPYQFVVVDGRRIALTESQVATSLCSENCVTTQYFNFPLSNELLLQSAHDELIFELQNNNGNNKLLFSIPGGYIKALLQSSDINTSAVNKVQKREQDPVVISQRLFVKASPDEKEIFTKWAFANRQEDIAMLDSESQILTMLAYWFDQADRVQKAEILSWVISL